jgi:hypothetical protein
MHHNSDDIQAVLRYYISLKIIRGFVNELLSIHDTTKLLAVDANIVPVQIAAHGQASVYALTEKVCMALSLFS